MSGGKDASMDELHENILGLEQKIAGPVHVGTYLCVTNSCYNLSHHACKYGRFSRQKPNLYRQ